MIEEHIGQLASPEIQEYIFENSKADEKKLLLKHKNILGLPARFVAQQISARKKAAHKIALFHQTKGIVYPPSLNLEQSSSEATAKFKKALIAKNIGDRIKVADLTGGFGIDSFFISEIAVSLDFVEPNQELIKVAEHNHSLLGRHNISYKNEMAEDFVERNSAQYDLIFIDPSRRDSKAKKIFSLSDSSPDITSIIPILFDRSNHILIKCSPLLDILQGLMELDGVKKVFVISVANECKELLFLLEMNFKEEPQIETYNLDAEGDIKHPFEFTFSEEANSTSQFRAPQKYLYEPNASILKSGAFKLVGKKFGLGKIHVNTHLYTSDNLLTNFPGRVFEIENLDFDVKSMSTRKANVLTRNFPMSSDRLKKKLKISDGGEQFVIAFSGQEKIYITLARRIK
ncbi:MAG TPA: SAM-dependent methyltransferase [Cytophagales bacterium]|jgi:hypothetical protein|nr:SAM-dependent methyltransferase [Cytophagales bacterium]